MSMHRALRAADDRKPVSLYYGNRREELITFRQELDEINRGGGGAAHTVTHVLEDPSDEWQGHRAYIGWQLIREELASADTATGFYICGPPPMMDFLIPQLYRAGVAPSRVHFGRFAL
jgi:ferredoxin-NADP reductase